MNFEQAFYDALDIQIERSGSENSFATKIKIKQPRLHVFRAKRNEPNTKGPNLDVISTILDNLDDDIFIDIINKIKPHLYIDKQERHIKVIKVFPIKGVKNIDQLKQQEPKFVLRIPNDYFPSDFGIIVNNHSMEDEFPLGSAVGIEKINAEEELITGDVYLCQLDYEGLVLRKVEKADRGGFEFLPLNPKYKSETLVPDKAFKAILGHATWVAKKFC